MYKTGDKVTVPDPDGNGRIAATFLNTADETVTIANSRVGGDKRKAHTAWIRYEEGESAGLTERFTFAEAAGRPVARQRRSRPLSGVRSVTARSTLSVTPAGHAGLSRPQSADA
jgi:hypothetical protein